MIIYKDISEDGEYLVQIVYDGIPKTVVAVCKDTYEVDLVVSALRCALTVMGVCNKEVNNIGWPYAANSLKGSDAYPELPEEEIRKREQWFENGWNS